MMNGYRRIRSTLAPHGVTTLCLALALAGCVSVPADKAPLAERDLGQLQLATDLQGAQQDWPAAQWWTQYHDAQLDTLEQKALAANPTLETAAARIQSAESTLAISTASQDVDFSFDSAANRQRYSANGLFPAPIGGGIFNDFSFQLQARYTFDWWGKNRAQIAAAIGEANARRAEYAQAQQSLAAAVAQHYFTLQGDWSRLAVQHQAQATQQALVDDQRARIAHGLATRDAEHQAEAQRDALQQQIAALDAHSLGEREALRALVGGGDALPALKPTPIADLTPGLPHTLGFELLARRPDLQAAHWRIEASLSRVDAAQAAFYPDINLSASLGMDSLTLDHLLEHGSHTFFIGPALSLPIFDSRAIKGRLQAARSDRNALIADYNQRVLDAVRDVAQAGATLRGIDQQRAAQQQAQAATDAVLQAAQRKLKQGLSERAAVLDAQLALLRQQDSAAQLTQQRLATEVALITALGGGFHADTPAPQAAQAGTHN